MPEPLVSLVERLGGDETLLLAALREFPGEWLPFDEIERGRFAGLRARMDVASVYPWVYEVRWAPGDHDERVRCPVEARAVRRKVRVPETMPAKTGSRTWEMDPERYFSDDRYRAALPDTEHDPNLAPTLGFEDE